MFQRLRISALTVASLSLIQVQGGGCGGPAASNPDAGPASDSSSGTPEASDSGTQDGGLGDVPASDLGTGPDVTAGQTCLAPRTGDPAALLSATGCVDPQNPRLPARSLIPYDVNSALWSDDADKQRFIALPDGKKIHIRDCATEPAACDVNQSGISEDGHLDFPVGTVLVKSFLINGTPIETRLLIHANQNFWRGFSYQWNEAVTDAMLLPDLAAATERKLANQTWQFPSRTQCLQCHTEPAGRSLGPTVAQLNRDLVFPSGPANQLTALERMGVLDAPLARPPAMLPSYPSPTSAAATLDQRVKSYLHANCAICHRPGGSFTGMDLRFETAFKDQELCNVVPMRGNAGVNGAVRLAPDDPGRSIVSLRMHTLVQEGMVRMPQIGSLVVDMFGTTLIDEWIRSIKSCP